MAFKNTSFGNGLKAARNRQFFVFQISLLMTTTKTTMMMILPRVMMLMTLQQANPPQLLLQLDHNLMRMMAKHGALQTHWTTMPSQYSIRSPTKKDGRNTSFHHQQWKKSKYSTEPTVVVSFSSSRKLLHLLFLTCPLETETFSSINRKCFSINR